jgi:tRNA nucleotidyltransferase (CCA-adding enzyme)
MEKSPTPGTCFSSQLLAPAEVERDLALLSGSGPIRALLEALKPSQLFLVGGLVRDAFHSLLATDIDVATDLTPQEVASRCGKHHLRVIETGIQHGTVLVVIDGTHIEVTTFREPQDRSEQVCAHDIKTDLSGRDFTINAIAFDITTSKLCDPFNGASDLINGVLRAVGSAEDRIIEDPLRILRMIRFGPATGRVVDTELLTVAGKQAKLLDKVSPERIRTELDKILLSRFPAAAIRTIKELGLLPYTIPELLPAIGFEQNVFHTQDVFEHTMTVLDRSPADRILRWSAIFHDVGKPHTLSVDPDGSRHFYLHEVASEREARLRMRELKFSNDDADTIALIVREHMRPLDCGAPGVRRILRDLGPEIERWQLFKRADASPTLPIEAFEEAAARFNELRRDEEARVAGPVYGKLAISGDHLIALGMAPGPKIGQILKALIEIVLDDPSRNERSLLLAEAQRLIQDL